jgi:hypothetical protein
MPTSEKPKPPEKKPRGRPKEFFYRNGPHRADEALHNPILDDGDHDAALAVTRRRMKKRGMSDEEIDRFMGKTPSK